MVIGKLNKSDGVTIFIKENIKLIIINENVLSNCKSLEISFEQYHKKYTIIGLYMSPKDNNYLFLNGLELYLCNIDKSYSIIFCGDINIYILSNSIRSTEYLNILSQRIHILYK